MDLIVIGLQVVTLLVLVFMLWTSRRWSVKHVRLPIPRELPSDHRWLEPPVELIRTEGTFDRWTCQDCLSHIDLLRGVPRTF